MNTDKLDDYFEGINRWIDGDTAGIFAWTASTEYAHAKYKEYLERNEDLITGMTAEERHRILNDDEYLQNLALRQDLERAQRTTQRPNFASSKRLDDIKQNDPNEYEMLIRVFNKYPKIVKMIDEIPTDEMRRLEDKLLKKTE